MNPARAALIFTPIVGVLLLGLLVALSYLPSVGWRHNQLFRQPSPLSGQPFRVRVEKLLSTGDVPHYTRIAESGYAAPDTLELAFFPGWPWMMRAAHRIVPFSLPEIGALVSLLLWTAAVSVWCTVVLDTPMLAAAGGRRVLLLLLVYPSTVFNVLAYPESAFLLFSGVTLHCARRDRGALLLVSMCALVLTKHVGALLGLLLVLWMLLYRPRLCAWAAGGYALGIAIVLALNFAVAGDALAWAHAQNAWGRHLSFPWEIVASLHGQPVDLAIYVAFLFIGPALLLRLYLRSERTEWDRLALLFCAAIFLPVWLGGSCQSLYRVLYLVPFALAALAGSLSRKVWMGFVGVFLLLDLITVYRLAQGFHFP